MAFTQTLYTFYSQSPSSKRLNEYINLIDLNEVDNFIDLEPLYFSGNRKIVLSNIDMLLIEEVCNSLDEDMEIVISLMQDIINYIFRDTVYNTKNLTRDTIYYELFPVFLFENENFIKILTYLVDHQQIKFVMSLFQFILLRLQSYGEQFLAIKNPDFFIDKWYMKIPRTSIRHSSVSEEDEIFAWLDCQDGESDILPGEIHSPYINIADEYDEYDTIYDVYGPYFSDIINSTFVAAEFVLSKLKEDKSISDLEKYFYLKQQLNYISFLREGPPSEERELFYLIFSEYLELEKQKKSDDFNNYTKLVFPRLTLESLIEKSESLNDKVNKVYLNNQCILTIVYSNFGLSKNSYVSRITINQPDEQFKQEAFHILSYICLEELHISLPLNFFEGAKKWISQISEDEEYPSIEVWSGIALSYVNNQLIIERFLEEHLLF